MTLGCANCEVSSHSSAALSGTDVKEHSDAGSLPSADLGLEVTGGCTIWQQAREGSNMRSQALLLKAFPSSCFPQT